MNSTPTFFSYSRTDSTFVLKLAKDLREAGANVWLDQLDIKPGTRWDASVESALEASSTMIVVLSHASVESNNVMDEVSYALESGKKVIPILLNECNTPFRLKRLQRIDFTGNYESGLNQLLEALGHTKSTTNNKESAEHSTPGAPISIVEREKSIVKETIPAKKISKGLIFIATGALLLIIISVTVFALISNNQQTKREARANYIIDSTTNYNNMNGSTDPLPAMDNSGADTAEPSPVEEELKIGQKYQGGIIFYLDGTGKHGLIVAPEDQGGFPWAFDYSFPITTSQDFGSGAANTQDIVKYEGDGNYAAKVCYDLSLNGYDDWYLGSKNDFLILYQNRNSVGNIVPSLYWHSSGGDGPYAGYQDFNTGNAGSLTKNSTAYVRAMRSF